MDSTRFDALTRSLTDPRSRRRTLVSLLGGTLGLLGLTETIAKKRKPVHGEGKKKKKKKNDPSPTNQDPVSPSPLPPPPPSPPPPPPPPPCANGIKDGSESDVDCGGTCPRCVNGQTCTSRDDCVSAFCHSSTGLCAMCIPGGGPPCLSDATGTCSCHDVTGTCIKNAAAFRTSRCSLCPAETFCQGTADPTVEGCHYRCGAINYCPAGADNCQSDTTTCGNDGKCFQPLGGGPTRCGVSAGACGCTSDQACETNHGPQAFCVQITGPACTCGAGGPTTFCALPR